MTEDSRESRGDQSEQTTNDSQPSEVLESAQHPHASRRSVLWTVVDAVLALGIFGMLVTVTLQIIMRLAGQSLDWSEELTRFLFLWAVFLGMASGFRTGEHPRITVVLRLLPQTVRRLALHLYVLLGVFFFAIVAYYGVQLVVNQYRTGQTSPALQIGVFLISLAVAVSAVLAVVAHIQSAYFDPAIRRRIEIAEETLE